MRIFRILTIVIVPLSLCLCNAQTGTEYDTLVQQGNAQLQAGNSEQALAYAEQAAKVVPARWEAHALAGGSLTILHRYEDAADQLSTAIKNAPPSKQAALRTLRSKSLLSEAGPTTSGSLPEVSQPQTTPTTQAEIILWKVVSQSEAQPIRDIS